MTEILPLDYAVFFGGWPQMCGHQLQLERVELDNLASHLSLLPYQSPAENVLSSKSNRVTALKSVTCYLLKSKKV